MMQLAEEQVIEPATTPVQGTFRDLVETHKRSIHALAYDLTGNLHDAEDLSQEVFIKVYQGLDGFRGDAQLKSWLYRITLNTYLNGRRRKMLFLLRLRGDFDALDAADEAVTAPDDQAEAHALRQDVERALQSLSPRERSAFVLRHYHDLSVREVAGAMELAEGSVKSLLFRATRKLQKVLSYYRREPDGRLTP